MVVTTEELCPECGNFVPILHDVSGFCNACSEDLGYDSIPANERLRARMQQIALLPRGARKRTETCSRGHRYVPGSYAVRKSDGTRRCRLCDKINTRKKREKQLVRLTDPSDSIHGTQTAVRLGCRCETCGPAREVYNASRRGRPQ